MRNIYQDLKGCYLLKSASRIWKFNEAKYLMADEYLSGNVREKLITAKKSAELYPEDYNINVEALEKVQPKDLTASEISVRLGATWLPEKSHSSLCLSFLIHHAMHSGISKFTSHSLRANGILRANPTTVAM